jgi:asparagine synthase (glutamine-hydrolysing)
VFPDLPSVDESSYIQLVADRVGLDLHTYRPAARSLDDAVKWSVLMDGPVPTVSVPELNENYALARRLGYDTLLTGELAEFVIDQRRHLLGHLAAHARVRPLARMVRLHRRRGVSWGVIGRQLISPFVPGRIAVAYADLRGLDDDGRVPDWLNAREVDRRPYREDLLVPGRRRWLDQQLLAFPGPGVTIEADEVCQSINDVVVRRPFADVDLWEFFLALPAELKFPDAASKTLVRRCLRGRVPDEILDRRDKTAFNDHMVASADYESFERLLVQPRHRLRGVDYERLGERIHRREFTVYDHFWARDLAAVHAFLEAW